MQRSTLYFKSGKQDEFGNYRPISILPQFSKILEKLFYKKLQSFLNQFNILANSQYGFRPNHSTALALSDLTETIADALEQKKYCLGIFIDLKKAFDTVNHKILRKKLEHYGIRGCTLDWLKSYLNNRTQKVVFNDLVSDELTIECGVPQGSILGPLLFLIYINDIFNISDKLNPILFADDSSFICSDKSIDRLKTTTNNELKKLNLWFKLNIMSVNIEKSHYMIFGANKEKIGP